MARTDALRQQHTEIQAIAKELAGMLDAARLTKDAGPARGLLAQLGAKLTMHLAMEDKSLYPTLLGSKNDQARAAAKKFADEMGGIAKVFAAFNAKWATPVAIQAGAKDFVSETKQIFDALQNRIHRENTELYPLADTLT